MAKSASLIVAIQIGFVFDMAVTFAFDFHIQFLIAAPEFKVGIVGFDFGFHQVEFGFKFAIVLRFCLHHLRTARAVDFARQGIAAAKEEKPASMAANSKVFFMGMSFGKGGRNGVHINGGIILPQ